MTEGTDPTTIQLWMAAIPSTLLAVSGWYNRRTTKKVAEKSDANTQEIVDRSTTLVSSEIAALKSENAALKAKIEEVRQNQITISAKYTETMNVLSSEFGKAKTAFIRMNQKAPEPVPGEVKQVDEPAQPLGKVIVKP